MLKKQLKRLGAVALCAGLLLVPLLAAALPASASTVVLLEDTVLELEPYIPVSTFSLFPDDALDLRPSVLEGQNVFVSNLNLNLNTTTGLLGQTVFVTLEGITYQAEVGLVRDGTFYLGDLRLSEGSGLPFYIFFSESNLSLASAYFTKDYSGSVLSASFDAPEDGSVLFLGDLFTVGNSLLQLVVDISSAIVADPLLLMTTGVLFLGAVVGILGRMLSKS